MRSRKVSPGSVVTCDHEPVADQARPAGDRAADVGPRLLEDGRGLAGDRGLVDEPDPLDDVAVAGDRLAFLDDDDVALAQLRGADILEGPVGPSSVRGGLRAGLAQGGRLGATPRLGDGFGVGREQDGEPQPDRDLDREPEAARRRPAAAPVASAIAMRVTRTAVISTTNMTGFLIRRRGSSLRKACGMADRSRSGSMIPRGLGGSPDGFAPPRVTKRWKRRVPRPVSTDMRAIRRPFRRSGGAARRSDPARAPGRT